MSLSRALIKVAKEDKNHLRDSGVPKSFPVQFNPTEYSRDKSVTINEVAVPGLDAPLLQFIRGNNEKLTLDLFFDVTSTQKVSDVTQLTSNVVKLAEILPETHAPPRIEFIWGKLIFKAVVESVQQRYTLFSPEGTPLRATLSVVFRRYETLRDQLTRLKLKSSDHTRSHVVGRGETLGAIAYQAYGDVTYWRLIYSENVSLLPNPRRIAPGTVLRLPPLPASAMLSGWA